MRMILISRKIFMLQKMNFRTYWRCCGVKASTISTGRGNDNVNLNISGSQKAVGLEDSLLNTGIGNDKDKFSRNIYWRLRIFIFL